MKTNFDDPLSFEATVRALAEVFAVVIKGEARNDALKELAMGITADTGRPILQLTPKGGRKTNVGYLWSFSSGEAFSDELSVFSLSLIDEDDDIEPDWDYNEVESTLKLVCLSIIGYQWSRHAALQPVPMAGEIKICNDMEDGAIVISLAIDMPDKSLDKIMAYWCQTSKSRQLVKALLKMKSNKNLLNGIAKLGLDESINLLLPPGQTSTKKKSVKRKKS